MRILFTVTLFLSSALLFLIQPMIAKMILPRFGGSPGVWNTSMLFFQAALLAGYGYAHLTTKWLGPRVQALTHIAVLFLPILLLPIQLPAGIQTGEGNQPLLVLLILTLSVGLPFFVTSAGAPLLQKWFATTKDRDAKDPYFLYSASNLGSMIALLAYPFLIEPRIGLREQSRLWTLGYVGLFLLMAACAVALWFQRGKEVPVHEAPTTMPPQAEDDTSADEAVSWRQRILWIALAFCPSSLMLGVTTFLTSNIAPVPLLWVMPLALYLLTFIIAFARKQVISTRLLGRILPLLVAPLAFTIILESSDANLLLPLIGFHLLVFFAVALLCHSALADRRPHPKHLTEFYFFVSVGGVLGGIFNALIAPSLFNTFFEYPLVLAIACFFRPKPADWTPSKLDWIYPIGVAIATALIALVVKATMPDVTQTRAAIAVGIPLVLIFIATDRPTRFALSLLLYFLVLPLMEITVGGRIIQAKRSFFGVHRIEEYQNKHGVFHSLVHGNTVHGRENFGDMKGEPLTYYHTGSPVGQALTHLGPELRDVALVGLGVGSLAYYGRPGQRFTYYEIDPDVVDLASNPNLFTFVSNCKAELDFRIGDARLELAKAPNGSYDLIVLDAFSSDSIPIHLMTKEAIEGYFTKLRPDGMLLFHISNRYLNLGPVLANEAQALRVSAWEEADMWPDYPRGKFASRWVLLSRDRARVQRLRKKSLSWIEMKPVKSVPVWTDDYSNIVSVFRFRPNEDED